MLEIRPNCEYCNRDLPADTVDAMICSYECTFCKDCVDSVLENVCPNCGGGLTRRPIRPRTARRQGVSLAHQPASCQAVRTRYSEQDIREFAARVKTIAARDR